MKDLISICPICGFKMNGKYKKCPICDSQMNKIKERQFDENPNLPNNFIINDNREVKLGYYCYKCKKNIHQHVCLNCNTIGYMIIEYHNKRAILPRINHLNEVFTNEEVQEIALSLTQEEKCWISHQFMDSYRLFYKRDKVKFGVCLFTALLMYFTSMEIFFYFLEKEYLFVGYFVNGIGNTLFSLFFSMSIWYLFDASVVEYKKIPAQIAIFMSVPNIIQVFICMLMNWQVKGTLISGFIFILLELIIYFIYVMVGKKHEK